MLPHNPHSADCDNDHSLMYSNVKLQIRDGPLFFGGGDEMFWGHKQFVSVSLSLQSDFSNCIILACVAGGFLDGAGVFFILWFAK